jgi:hypothetical protein
MIFGHESRKAGDTDTLYQLHRTFDCLGSNRLFAQAHQSKGMIERQFDFWQKQLPAVFAMASVSRFYRKTFLLPESPLKKYTHSPQCDRISTIISMPNRQKSCPQVAA